MGIKISIPKTEGHGKANSSINARDYGFYWSRSASSILFLQHDNQKRNKKQERSETFLLPPARLENALKNSVC